MVDRATFRSEGIGLKSPPGITCVDISEVTNPVGTHCPHL